MLGLGVGARSPGRPGAALERKRMEVLLDVGGEVVVEVLFAQRAEVGGGRRRWWSRIRGRWARSRTRVQGLDLGCRFCHKCRRSCMFPTRGAR